MAGMEAAGASGAGLSITLSDGATMPTIGYGLYLIPPDEGHFGGCDSYDFGSGSCAIQDNEGLKGDHEWKWDVAAVAAMSAEAVRSTDTGFCRAWFADDNH